MSPSTSQHKVAQILVIQGQGIGPECIEAAKVVLDATGLSFAYVEGSLGFPDARDLLRLLQHHAPDAYAAQFAQRAPDEVGAELEAQAKEQARAAGNINEFYKRRRAWARRRWFVGL